MAMDAAALLGLSSCMIGHFIQHEQEVNALLNVKGEVRLALGLVIGYAKTNTPPRAKTNRCYDEAYDINVVQQNK
ncbi:hypothetical protein FACS1894218_7190 [Bacilli bacterium]|nr:hypothetical protein FACS1894218_7190 [Bacilli bacterium]